MKTRVRVPLVARCEVEIEVEHEPDDDPCDLTEADRRKALRSGDRWQDWEVDVDERIIVLGGEKP